MDDLTTFDHFGQFAFALDGIGLPDEWSPFGRDYGSVSLSQPGIQLSTPGRADCDQLADTAGAESPSLERSETPFSSWLPSAPEGSHISINGTGGSEANAQSLNRWKLSTSDRNSILESLRFLGGHLEQSFELPSRHTLSRYLTIFFGGFNQNLPFIHHTWSPVNSPVELVLVICAIGAQNCCENGTSEQLFGAAKSAQLYRLHDNIDRIGPKTASLLSLERGLPCQRQDSDPPNTRTMNIASIASPSGWHPVSRSMLQSCYLPRQGISP